MEAFAPIPPPNQDDDEDVHWALATAGALWNRGEHAEALKYLRRAAETASDANADARALELFKAAAEVTSKVNTSAPPPPSPSSYPQAAPPAAPSYPQAAPDPARPPPPRKKPPPALPHRGSQPAPAAAPAPAQAPARQPSVRQPQPAATPASAPHRAEPAPQPRPAAGMPAAAPPQRQPAAGGRRTASPAAAVPVEPPARARGQGGGSSGLRLDSGSRGAGRGAAAAPQPAPSPARRPLFDDLEEDTRVLQGAGRSGDAVEQTIQAMVSAPQPNVMEGLDENTPTDTPLGMIASPDSTGLDGATAPQIPIPRLATVPSLRVAVMSAGVPGEVRLVPLDGGGPAPPGAAVAMLVPLTVADSDEVTKLFGFLV